MAGKHSYTKRGYLLDAASEPLSSAQIARLLNFSAATMRKMLAKFEKVKLLELVDMPQFSLSKNEGGDTKKQPKKGKKQDNVEGAPSVPKRS